MLTAIILEISKDLYRVNEKCKSKPTEGNFTPQ